MNITAQLDGLSTAEKLRTMEYLWDGLCRHADEIPAPSWHRDVLSQRVRSIKNELATFNDWDAEKSRIRNALK
jgi:hypothetical protein